MPRASGRYDFMQLTMNTMIKTAVEETVSQTMNRKALTGQHDGDLAASSPHSPTGLCGRCPPPLRQLCQEDLSSFLAFFSGALLFMASDTVSSTAVFIIVFIVNRISFISARHVRHIFLYLPGRRL